jgi:hypothetical protein
MRGKQEALRQIDNQISQTGMVRDNMRTVIDNIQTSIAVIRTEIEKIGNASDKLRTEMTLLEDRRGRIDHARLVKEPTSSLDPVFPRKIESVLVAGFLGFIGFTGIAIFVDRLQSRSRQRAAAAAHRR